MGAATIRNNFNTSFRLKSKDFINTMKEFTTAFLGIINEK